MISTKDFSLILKKISGTFSPVVPFYPKTEKITSLDLSPANLFFSALNYESTPALSDFITEIRMAKGARYLVGGYGETRNMYRRSQLFDKNLTTDTNVIEEPRNIHLGIDIWGDEDTPVFAPMGGMVHSFANNNNFGDYGATIILQHQIDMFNFYTLYGHLALKDLAKVRSGQFITRGQNFAHFGKPTENGNWPPHLHFQLIIDIGNAVGDYPGVCKKSEALKFLENCPDPDSILNLSGYISQ